MSVFFTVLMAIAMLATLGVLFAGIITMGRGGEAGRLRSNRLMRLRVIFQGVAIVCFLLAVLLR
jgi:hypothetical protein